MSFAAKLKTMLQACRKSRLRSAGHCLGDRVRIGRNVHISGHVIIGDDTIILDGAVLQGQISIGSNSRIEKLAEIMGNVEVGNHTVIGSYSFLSTMPNAKLKIGDDVLVNSYSILGASNRVDIGNHCIFAAYVQITDSEHGIDDPAELIKNAAWSSAPVFIDENVWLGSGVMVTKGVSIGAGSVIGAKALVNRDIPPMSIAYGIPARVMRSRTAKVVS